MQRPLTQFVRALRTADVRVSPAETLDAIRVVDTIGWADRARLKDALGATLAKSRDEQAVFEACFDQFFRFASFAADDPAQVTDEAPQAQADGEDDTAASVAAGEGSGGGAGAAGNTGDGESDIRGDTARPDATARIRAMPVGAAASPLGRLLMADDHNALATAIARAAGAHRLEEIQVFTQQGLYTRRILGTLGQAALMDEIAALESSVTPLDRRLAAALRERHDRLRGQIRDYVEGQFLLHADARGEHLRESLLRNARIANIARHDYALMRRVVERMARHLAAAHSRKRRVRRRGQLDVARMLRKNLRYDANMIELAWKSRRIERPRVFVVCDVSGSVALYARFMLLFIYSLQDVLPRTRAFAFAARLGEVTDLFEQHDLDTAIERTLAEHGQGSTDYATALRDFEALALDDIDRRATVLILGDARNNEGEPRADLLRRIRERCHRLVWLNPEPRASWDTGDSVIGRYRPHCHQLRECRSLAQLERVVSALLRNAR